MKKTSLYIPCFNAAKTIALCLESVFKQNYPIVEVIIVDDGSTDKTVSIAADFPVRILRHNINRGLAAARNTAINSIQTEFIASLDADCCADNDWLSSLMLKFDDSAVTGVGGKLVEDRITSVFDLWRSVHMRQYWVSENYHPDFLFGANTVFRRKALLDVGLYNELYRSNYEDVDLSRRITDGGGKIVYVSGAIVHHLKEDDVSSLFNAYWKWNIEYYQQKKFYSDLSSFSNKIKDNVGLANRYLNEDLEYNRNSLLYLDFLLLFHHSMKDFFFFLVRDKESCPAKENPRLSAWLALVDLTFSYHYSGKSEKIQSFLYSKEAFTQNFIALILMIDQCLGKHFSNRKFNRLVYKHLFITIYRVSDDVLLDKILDLTELHPEWSGFIAKKHLYLNKYLLEMSGMIGPWLDSLRYRYSNIVELLECSQEKVELDLHQKGLGL